MKKMLLLAAAAAALAGCQTVQYTEVSDGTVNLARVDGGDKPLASFYTAEVSYSLLGQLDFDRPASIDDNLAELKKELAKHKTTRVENLVTTIDEERAWSCFVIKRRTVKSTALILAPEK